VIIKLLSLQAKGFKQLDFDKEITFPDGALLIFGRNESGKSTIMEAIHYALYGMPLKPSKRASIDDILNYGLDVGFVKLVFSIGEDIYDVKRTIKRKGKSIHELRVNKQDGTKEAISGAHTVDTAIIDALHGIDSDALLNSCLVEQKELGKLESSQRKERINTVSTLLNLEAFTTAEQELKKIDREKSEELNGNLKEKGIKAEVEEWKNKKEDYEEALNKKAKAELRLKELAEELPRIERKVKELESKLNAVSKIKEILGEMGKLQTRYSRAIKDLEEAENLKSKLKELNEDIVTQRKVIEAEEKLESVEELVSDIEGNKNLRNREEKDMERLRLRLKGLEGIEEKLLMGEKQLKELRESKEQALRNKMLGYIAIGGGTIGLILGLFAPELLLVAVASLVVGMYLVAKSKTGKIDLEIGKKETELNGMRAESLNRSEYEQNLGKKSDIVVEMRKKIEESTHRLLMLVDSLPNAPTSYKDNFMKIYPKGIVDAKKMLVRSVSGDRNRLTQMETHKKSIQPIVDDLENRENRVRELEEKIEKSKSEKAKIEEDFQVKVEHEDVLRRNYGEMSGRKGELENEKKDRHKIKEECERIIEQNKEAPEKYEIFLRKKEELEFDLEAINRAKKLLNLARDTVFGSVKERIESNMMKFLPLLTAGRYKFAKIDERQYKIEVYDKEAQRLRIKGVFSGATQDQISLALRLAFALSTLPSSRGVVPGFIFLDEPLSGFDEERKKGLLELLTRGDIAEQFIQILVISHGEQLRDEFPYRIHLDRGRIID